MTEPTVHRFSACLVRIFAAERYLETVFADGTKVPAAAGDSEADVARAHALGYGGDTWAMTRDHELLHTSLAENAGLSYSPTLWALAHGEPMPPDVQREEGLVLHVQRLINRGWPAILAETVQ